MRPQLHPWLVNGRSGDPALYIETLHRNEAILCDMGDLTALSPRHLMRVSHVLVSHCHLDHFIGFDSLLRASVGRDKRVALVGPRGFADRIFHRLQGYDWDLAERYQTDLVFDVTELLAEGRADRQSFRFKRGFAREEPTRALAIENGTVASGPGFAVTATILQHHGPCLGFAIAEPFHVNIWKNRLVERGLATGPWLQTLRQAVIDGRGDDCDIPTPQGTSRLGALRDLLTITRGQKIAYVTDVLDTPANRRAIAALAEAADTLFIESRFAATDQAEADARAHLTTRAAGEIAREAGVRRLEPFHFSPRYEGEEERMLNEALAAFQREEPI